MNKSGLIIILLTIFSCSRSEECGEPTALNYDANAIYISLDQCIFSSVTFYAGGSTITGEAVSEITLTINEDEIGRIASFDHVYPENCDDQGTLKYIFKSSSRQVWFARYNLVSGGTVTEQGVINPISSKECIRVDILP